MKKEVRDSNTKKESVSVELRINTDKKILEAENKFVSYVRSGSYGKKR